MQRCIILLSQCSDGVAALADDARNEVVVHCELTGMLETSVKVSSFKKTLGSSVYKNSEGSSVECRFCWAGKTP